MQKCFCLQVMEEWGTFTKWQALSLNDMKWMWRASSALWLPIALFQSYLYIIIIQPILCRANFQTKDPNQALNMIQYKQNIVLTCNLKPFQTTCSVKRIQSHLLNACLPFLLLKSIGKTSSTKKLFWRMNLICEKAWDSRNVHIFYFSSCLWFET